MSPEQIEAAIAATLQAMILEVGGAEELATILPPDELPIVATSLAETVVAQLTATHAITATPTRTPSPTLAGTQLVTTGTPTLTSTETTTPSPSPSITLTSTRTPTRTLTPSATITPSRTPTLPPTNTPSPTVNVCTLISVGGVSPAGGTARWTITNNSGGTITLDSMILTWPASNDAIFNIFLKGSPIWSGYEPTSPTSITFSGGARQINSSANLEVFFGSAAASGYNLSITFSNGCQASRTN